EGVVDKLALGFDIEGRLVDETMLREHLPAERAARTARQIVESLAAVLGPPAQHAGLFDTSALARGGTASISTVAYRFEDYVADVSTTNLGVTGPMLREHYMSGRD
ncbi:MAG: hypothetical protein FWD17_12620, partial [Polyangiaceae bacterium]|nr:hypothetical protein [Polyangiaceae bacterium]